MHARDMDLFMELNGAIPFNFHNVGIEGRTAGWPA